VKNAARHRTIHGDLSAYTSSSERAVDHHRHAPGCRGGGNNTPVQICVRDLRNLTEQWPASTRGSCRVPRATRSFITSSAGLWTPSPRPRWGAPSTARAAVLGSGRRSRDAERGRARPRQEQPRAAARRRRDQRRCPNRAEASELTPRAGRADRIPNPEPTWANQSHGSRAVPVRRGSERARESRPMQARTTVRRRGGR